jgi:uncharacterized protein YbaR (Trm112 family)
MVQTFPCRRVLSVDGQRETTRDPHTNSFINSGRNVISPEFLQMLRCPLSRSPLSLADKQLLARVQQAVSQRKIKTRAGDTVTRLPDGGLINQDGSLLYPIYNGIPTLIADEAIPLEQLGRSGV